MKQLRLPRKDKDGNVYISYSQMNKFITDIDGFVETYIEGKPWEGNAYTDFGTKVGEALEHNDFKGFAEREKRILTQVPRLDIFEREIKLKFNGFYVKGFIDTAAYDFRTIADYKTGGKRKEFQYQEDKYSQLALYALGVKQETGIMPEQAKVIFMRRDGNAFKGEKLTLAAEKPLLLDVDISTQRLINVYDETEAVAHEMERFCKQFKF
jgi:hypothetical protein